VFDRAIAPSSWTLPSHASIFTGRDPNELSADWWIPLDDTHPTLAEVLTEAGYATTAFSANIAYANRETGLARGFARFDDYTRTTGEAIRTSVMLRRTLRRFGGGALINDDWDGRRTADHVNGSFLRWLDRSPEDRPFFAFLNFMDGHDPYYSASPFDTLYPPVEPHAPLTWGKPPSADLQENWTNGYDRAITYLDDRLTQLFDSLAARGALDNTIVVVTSDHGEHLGEFGYMRHGNTLYMPVLHVPLLVRYPASVPGGVRVGTTVGVRDIAATVLELARIDAGALGGESFAGGWQGDTLGEREIYAGVGEAIRVPARYPNTDTDLHSLIAGGFQYIRTVDGPEELLRLTEDDAAPIDLTRAPQSGPTLERMRRDLDRRLGASSDTRATARGPESR
jgi:arylsulfatase A-like enzyme